MWMIQLEWEKVRGTKEPLNEGEKEREEAGLNSVLKNLRSWHVFPSFHGK